MNTNENLVLVQSVEALPKEDSCVATTRQHFLAHSVLVYDCLEPAISARIFVTFHYFSKVAIPIGAISRSSPSDGKKYYDFIASDLNYLNNFNTGGLHGTEEVFLLPAQQPWVRIPASPIFLYLRKYLFKA